MRVKALTTAGLIAATLALTQGLYAIEETEEYEQVALSDELAAMNAQLRAAGVTRVSILKAELLVSGPASAGAATTLLASDRTHLLPVQFVENDPRRSSPAETITYLVDQSDGRALSVEGGGVVVLPNAVTEPEIDTSMSVWAAMPCNGPAMLKVADGGADPDWVDNIVAGLPLPAPPSADVVHAGWLPAAFFDALVPDGSDFILGATLTLIFVDDENNPTDIDRDGRIDVAWQEIYYNRSFPWRVGGNAFNIDIQSVAIHEAGHALGLAHFGAIFIKENGALQFAPKAVMNAGYVAEDRTIYGTDNASFCQAWARSQ